ncbi:hypothetical protein GCM10010349_47100 [Streptomyces flavofungini]|nr:hypothetical protein GCM10010349_47100 [Streptomyces flavofungini]
MGYRDGGAGVGRGGPGPLGGARAGPRRPGGRAQEATREKSLPGAEIIAPPSDKLRV